MNSASDSPYISFIGFNRNDNYTANNKAVYNTSLNVLLQQLKEFKIPSEIVIVEWNYIENQVPLAETISLEIDTAYTKVRVIRVPSLHHKKYKYWQHKAFHVGAAINVGVRRAKGKFILPVASDVFLTDAVFKLISQANLQEDKFYRCDRYDVDPIVLNGMNKYRQKFFESCRTAIKCHHKYIVQEPTFRIAELHTNACGDFYLQSRELFESVRGCKEGKDVGSLDIDSLLIHALNGSGIQQVILPDECRVYKMFHEKSTSRAVNNIWLPWQKLLDRFLRLSFYQNNMPLLNMRLLLNYPKRSYSYAPEAIFDSFLTNFVKPARRWAKKLPPFYLNNEEWGLANIDLEETTIRMKNSN